MSNARNLKIVNAPGPEVDEQPSFSAPILVVLHLGPGLIFAGCFFLLANVFRQIGLSGYLALLLTIPVCLAPMELGVMLLWSTRNTGRRSLSDAVTYDRPSTTAEYLLLTLVLLLSCGFLTILVLPISQYLEAHLTFWLPPWLTQQALILELAGRSMEQRVTALGLGVLLSGFVAPVVEELYFRGFLLPRMGQWGWAAPAVNAFLFAATHFYFPGNVPGIFIAFIPICYVARRMKNWRIGAIVHGLSNLWGVISVAMLVL